MSEQQTIPAALAAINSEYNQQLRLLSLAKEQLAQQQVANAALGEEVERLRKILAEREQYLTFTAEDVTAAVTIERGRCIGAVRNRVFGWLPWCNLDRIAEMVIKEIGGV